MTQNLRYYWRQKSVALVDKQCKFSCIYWVRFERTIVKSANKNSYDSLSNLKSYILRLCAILHTIQSFLVHKNASHCSKISKKMIRQFYDIIKWLSCFS